MKKKLVTLFTYAFLIFFSIIFLNSIFNNKKNVIEFNMKIVSVVSIIFLIVLLTIYFMTVRYADRIKVFWENKHVRVATVTLTVSLIFILQIILAKSFYYPVGWDVKILRESSRGIALNEAVDYLYFLQFPNNVFLLWMFKYIFFVSTMFSTLEYGFALVIFNIIIIDLSVFLTILISKKIFGGKLTIITGILCTIFLLFSPWINVVYSDTLGALFPVLILYIYLKINECNKSIPKFLLSILVGIISVIAFQVKPTNMIILIAILISIFFYSIKDKKSFGINLCIISCIFIGFLSTKVIYNKTIGSLDVCGVNMSDNEMVTVPATHFVMMGMQESYDEKTQSQTYGYWCQQDYFYTFSFPGKKEKIDAHVIEIKNRLKNFGVKGYAKFLYNKANWMLNDGTFFYGGEGGFVYEEPSATNDFTKVIQNYYVPTNDGYVRTAYFNEGLWIVVLLLLVVPIFIRKTGEEEIFILRLTVIGIVTFLLFFEGRSRYLINHLPIFILLSVYGFKCIVDKIKSKKNI